MQKMILLCFLCCSLWLAQVPSVAEETPNPKWEEPTRWKTIHWQPDAESARREADLSGKPLMVFMFVNFKGKPGADQA